MIKRKILNLVAIFLLTITAGLPAICFAAQQGSDQLRVQTGVPKRTSETIFSSLVAWNQKESVQNKAKGLTFIDAKKITTDIEVAKKIAKSLSAGINYEAPRARGAKVKYTDNKAEFVITNTDGFDLNRVVFGDYTNQKLQFNVPGEKFSDVGVDIAIDLVYSKAVEYIDGFSSNIVQQTVGGVVTVTIDNNLPIEIQTKGKTTKQLEVELDKALGKVAHFSSQPIYPNIVELKSRNYKPYDGGEIQILGLNAKSITIDVNDPGLGVLIKFRFPAAINESEEGFNKSVMRLVGFLLLASLGYVLYARKKGKNTSV